MNDSEIIFCKYTGILVRVRAIKGKARVSRLGLKAWPSLRVRCSDVEPEHSLFGIRLQRSVEIEIESARSLGHPRQLARCVTLTVACAIPNGFDLAT